MALQDRINDFESFIDATVNARKWSERDRDYFDGNQLTEEETKELKKRKQPPIVINRVGPKVKFMLGMERRTRTDPKAFPRNPNDEEGANAATDALRYIADINKFDITRSLVFENMIVEGYGAAEVIVKRRRGELEITINHIPWDRAWYDPYSRTLDHSDDRFKGLAVWMDLEDAKAKYKKSKNKEANKIGKVLTETAFMSTSDTDTFGDKPSCWFDSKRKRVRVLQEYFKKDGEWWFCEFTKAGFIQEERKSPYKNSFDEQACPIEIQDAAMDREGRRYGEVRNLIDIQDEVNKRRSKALHILNTRGVIMEKGAVGPGTEHVEKARAEVNRPDGVVEVNKNMRFDIESQTDLAQGQFSLLQEAKNEIDVVGANAALAGKDDRNLSGRALEQRQQGGTIELGSVYDWLREFQNRIYTHAWDRVKQYWTKEKWVRVTDDENNIKFVGFNEQVRPIDEIRKEAEEVAAAQKIPAEFMPQLVNQLIASKGMAANDPRLEIPQIKNNVAEINVDIVIDEMPDMVTLQSEQVELLAEINRTNPGAIPPDMIIEAMPNLRNKDKILAHLRGEGLTPEQQQAQQQQQQFQQRAQAAEVAKVEGEAQDKQASAQDKQASAQLKAVQTQKTQVEAQQMAQGFR